ncbi:mycothiol transferase [Nocardioides pacificus]
MITSGMVNVFTGDMEAAIVFYRDRLGLAETFRTPASGTPEHIEFAAGGFTLGLGTVEAARRVHGIDSTPGTPAMALVLWNDDVDATYADLVAAGAPAVKEPHDAGNDNRNAVVRDPDGNLVELVSKTAGPSRARPDMWVDPEDDPREGGPSRGDERTTLLEYLRTQRLTLEMKCSGLNAAQLARRSVPPSTMSLLGLVRHLADVELSWSRRRLAGQEVDFHFRQPDNRDAAFDGDVADPVAVEEAWAAWRAECAFTDQFVHDTADLSSTGSSEDGPISVREVLVHLIEEYARHNGHADLLRERIDGRTGE